MRLILSSVVALGLYSGAAFADSKVSADEAAKLQGIVSAWGCEGGTFEKETEGTGVYEAEDVKCKSGNYDFRIDKNFNLFAITVD